MCRGAAWRWPGRRRSLVFGAARRARHTARRRAICGPAPRPHASFVPDPADRAGPALGPTRRSSGVPPPGPQRKASRAASLTPWGRPGLQAVQLAGAAPPIAAGAVVLDARGARPASVADRLIEALAAGAPVLGCGETPLLQRLRRRWRRHLRRSGRRPGSTTSPPCRPPSCRPCRTPPAPSPSAGSTRTRPAPRCSAPWNAPAPARRVRHDAWMRREPGLGPGGHVLVISDEALNLVDIRIHLPFAALHRRGLIDGYTVLRHGEVAFSTAQPDQALRFDMIWVHRSVDTGVQFLLQRARPALRLRRGRQSAGLAELPRRLPGRDDGDRACLLRRCTVLSCATPALFHLLQRHSALNLAGKAVITPNLAQGTPLADAAGPAAGGDLGVERPAGADRLAAPRWSARCVTSAWRMGSPGLPRRRAAADPGGVRAADRAPRPALLPGLSGPAAQPVARHPGLPAGDRRRPGRRRISSTARAT